MYINILYKKINKILNFTYPISKIFINIMRPSFKPRSHNLIILFEKFLHNNYPGIINLRKVELPKSKTVKCILLVNFPKIILFKN